MSVTMTKSGEVTMLTLTSNSRSTWPLLCQMFGGLCCSPTCCSVSRRLRAIMGTSQSVLGALHIMVGLLNIGLGAILMGTETVYWQMRNTGFPHWLGALFILFGIVCILSEKFPSPCLVLVNVLLNFLGIAFAIAGIVLYAYNVSRGFYRPWGGCNDWGYRDGPYWSRRRTTTTSTLTPAGKEYMKLCVEGLDLAAVLARAINGVAIVLCVLELCVVISSFVLAIKSLCCHGNSEDDGNCERHDNQQQSRDEPEGGYKSLLEEA
ncbi:membrane-spanning 4-domains subfamily A member 8-like [Festucalex cinctus]